MKAIFAWPNIPYYPVDFNRRVNNHDSALIVIEPWCRVLYAESQGRDIYSTSPRSGVSFFMVHTGGQFHHPMNILLLLWRLHFTCETKASICVSCSLVLRMVTFNFVSKVLYVIRMGIHG